MRGISSNKVINNCFELHIHKNRNNLDEPKMREILSTLKKDLGIPDNENKGIIYKKTMIKILISLAIKLNYIPYIPNSSPSHFT